MKFLFIRFSSIGDIVLTSPVIRCVKQQMKGAEIHFLLRSSFAQLLEHNPYVDKKYLYENFSRELITELRSERYDAVIDLQKNFRSKRIVRALGVEHFTFDKINIQKFLLVNFKINRLPNQHIVDRYMKAVNSFGVENDGKGLDYFISSSDEDVFNQLPQTHKQGYIAWVIGAKHFTKRLPIEKMISISKKINSPVVLLGGKEDFERGELLKNEKGAIFFNACGKFTLNQSAALVKNSKRVITHDTGFMHIAAAFKKNIISIWGNTIPEFGMYPYFGKNTLLNSANHLVQIENGDQHSPSSIILETKGLSCRPCSKIGFEKCPRGHFKCMRDIDESIFEKL